MNFTCITDVPAFLQRIQSCHGSVRYVDEHGVERDLKRLSAQVSEFGRFFMPAELHNLEVHASALDDRLSLMRYMSEMGRSHC